MLQAPWSARSSPSTRRGGVYPSRGPRLGGRMAPLVGLRIPFTSSGSPTSVSEPSPRRLLRRRKGSSPRPAGPSAPTTGENLVKRGVDGSFVSAFSVRTASGGTSYAFRDQRRFEPRPGWSPAGATYWMVEFLDEDPNEPEERYLAPRRLWPPPARSPSSPSAPLSPSAISKAGPRSTEGVASESARLLGRRRLSSLRRNTLTTRLPGSTPTVSWSPSEPTTARIGLPP